MRDLSIATRRPMSVSLGDAYSQRDLACIQIKLIKLGSGCLAQGCIDIKDRTYNLSAWTGTPDTLAALPELV